MLPRTLDLGAIASGLRLVCSAGVAMVLGLGLWHVVPRIAAVALVALCAVAFGYLICGAGKERPSLAYGAFAIAMAAVALTVPTSLLPWHGSDSDEGRHRTIAPTAPPPAFEEPPPPPPPIQLPMARSEGPPQRIAQRGAKAATRDTCAVLAERKRRLDHQCLEEAPTDAAFQACVRAARPIEQELLRCKRDQQVPPTPPEREPQERKSLGF